MSISTISVIESDFDELAAIRVAAMRESLERLGRFDPIRARERLRNSFSPEHTRFIVCDGMRVGFYAARPTTEGLRLDHLYNHPDFQGRCIGSAILKLVLATADAQHVPVLVGALKESGSNRFYQRHGFVLHREDEWDNYYIRPPSHNERANKAPEPTCTSVTGRADARPAPAAHVAHL